MGFEEKKTLLHQFSKREKIAFLEKQQYGDNFLNGHIRKSFAPI